MDLRPHADSIVHTIRESLLVLDEGMRVVAANPAFFRGFHVAREQTIGRSIFELGSGQWDNSDLRRLLNEIIPDNEQFNDFLVENDFPDIGRRTMMLNGRQLRNDGETPFILLAIEDITDRRQAELELARQRKWFQTTLSSIGDAVIATDPEAQITFMNPTAERLTGWTSADSNGQQLKDVFRIINEETRNEVESPVTKAIRRGAIVGLANHTLLIARDGTESAIDDSAAPIRDDDGKISGVVLVFHDIAERREAERKLEQSEARYRRFFEAAHDGILILDVDTGRVIDVNRFMLDLLRHPREHFVGKQLWELGVFQDSEASKSAMRELEERGYVRYEDLPLLDRDGRQVPVEFVSNRYHEDGHLVYQCNIRDISQRKQVERERESLLAQEHAARVEAQASERANRAKDLFLATLSHEMRTPLNAILGWASILRAGPTTLEERQEAIDVIERNARAQAKLIDDVLDISRIVSGKLRLDLSSCDLESVIDTAILTVRATAIAKNIQIDVNFDPAVKHSGFWCDSNRIQQVVWNLLSNAVKFCQPGSAVKVDVAPEGSKIRISVTDNGPGINPQLIPFIFDRFRQGDSSTRRKFGGLGLGLAIVKQLVELHGGSVRVESKGEGTGATFTVLLPVRAVQMEEGDQNASGNIKRNPLLESVQLNGLRILVVDDEPDARRLVTKVLEDAGAQVLSASNAPDAMRRIQSAQTRPNVLISDLSMPDEDGFDLIRQVRDAGHTLQQIPAIALTAFADKGSARSALLAGFQVHVAKPVDPNDLLAVVASLTGRTAPPPGK